MIHVLLIDDDEKLTGLLQQYLAGFGFKVSAHATPDAGLRSLRDEEPDAVVLDVMLPGIDGFAVLRRIREKSTVPVVMLTARGEVTDRILGLESGADDYLPKPFEPRELVARIHAVLRRKASPGDEVVRAGRLTINAATHVATVDGEPIVLTGAEFDLLLLLARHRGRVLSRDRILDETSGVDFDSIDRSIDVLISRLRQKLRDDVRQPAFIKTVRGKGYVLTGDDPSTHPGSPRAGSRGEA